MNMGKFDPLFSRFDLNRRGSLPIPFLSCIYLVATAATVTKGCTAALAATLAKGTFMFLLMNLLACL